METGGDERRQAAPPPLTVARIPALVREVDATVQTFGTSRLPTDPQDVVALCESVLARIEEIDDFRQTLRRGPLEAIVQKQVARLSAVLESLHDSGNQAVAGAPTRPSEDRIVLVETRRRCQVTPVYGNLLIKRTPSVHIAQGSASKQVTVRLPRHAKPIYKWEKRRHQHFTPSHGSPYAHRELMDDDANDATMELQPCSKPGHYTRSHMALETRTDPSKAGFEFQIILTETEVNALKFQRRQLQAEQRHLRRQAQAK